MQEQKPEKICFYSATDWDLVLTASPKVPEKEPSKVKMGSISRKCCSVDRSVWRVFGTIFSDVPVGGSELEMGHFNGRKTGLFGAVWIEDQKQGYGNLRGGRSSHKFFP